MNLNYKLYNILSNLVLLGALRVMFLIETGNTFVFIAVLLSIKSMSKLIFNLPIGLMADRYGRKLILYIGNIARVITYVFLLSPSNHWLLITSFVFWGLNLVCLELAEDAHVHDYGITKNEDFLLVRGNLKKQQVLANILINFLFAYLYSIDIYIPILMLIIISSLTFIPLINIKTVKIGIAPKIVEILQDIPKIFKEKNLSYTFVYGVCFLTILSLTIHLKYPVMEARGITGSVVGYLDSFVQLIAFFGLLYIKQIRDFTKNNLKEFMTVLLVVGLLLGGLTKHVGLIILIITPLAFTLGGLDITKRIADYSNARSKATYLAAKDFIVSLLIMILLPVIGFTTDNYSIYFSLLLLLFMLLICLLFIKLIYQKQVFKNELTNC